MARFGALLVIALLAVVSTTAVMSVLGSIGLFGRFFLRRFIENRTVLLSEQCRLGAGGGTWLSEIA